VPNIVKRCLIQFVINFSTYYDLYWQVKFNEMK